MKTVSVNWTPAQSNQNYTVDGHILRAYLDGTLVYENAGLGASADSHQFECAEGEMTVKVSAKCEAEESEPDSETDTVGGGSEPSINANIPQPTGVSIYIAP